MSRRIRAVLDCRAIRCAALGLGLLYGAPAVAEEIPPGQALYEGTCTLCHDDTFFTRPDRKMSNYTELLAQVDRCQEGIDEGWTPQQVRAVADYLNQRYYRFQD